MDLIDKKREAGNSTPAEDALKGQMEKISGDIITETVKEMQRTGKDIRPGSEEEVFMEKAIANSTRMGTSQKQRLSQDLKGVQEGTGGMIRMNKLLGDMIMK